MKREYLPKAIGDARHTSADINKAKNILGYSPQIPLAKGLEKEWEWIYNLMKNP